jgi:peptidoglycan/LPS O-acetylase OafA/YrhL
MFPGWICFLGDASYSIFLSHAIVLLPIGRFWGMFFSIPGKMDNLFVMITMTGLALSVGIGGYLIIERQISSFLKRAGTMLFRLPQPTPPRTAT